MRSFWKHIVLAFMALLLASSALAQTEHTPSQNELAAVASDAFRSEVCGMYLYEQPDDELEKRCFEISCIDGKFYLEYSGEYDYGGAELEILSMARKNSIPKNKRITFEVMVYPFSGFSFDGEYWGAGNKVMVTKWDNGKLQFSEEQPFLSGKSLSLTKAASEIFVHPILETKEACAACAKLHGDWRYAAEQDGERLEVFISFLEDGTFTAVKKKETYPVEMYMGIYTAEQAEDKLSGSVCCERFAYGSMPHEWVFTYDKERDRPVIVREYDGVNPFTLQKSDLPFERAKAGDRLLHVQPGPGKRAKAVETAYQKFCSIE